MEMHSEKERWRELQYMLQDGLTDNQQNYADFFKVFIMTLNIIAQLN